MAQSGGDVRGLRMYTLQRSLHRVHPLGYSHCTVAVHYSTHYTPTVLEPGREHRTLGCIGYNFTTKALGALIGNCIRGEIFISEHVHINYISKKLRIINKRKNFRNIITAGIETHFQL
jgi:hypothetical protein